MNQSGARPLVVDYGVDGFGDDVGVVGLVDGIGLPEGGVGVFDGALSGVVPVGLLFMPLVDGVPLPIVPFWPLVLCWYDCDEAGGWTGAVVSGWVLL